MKNKPQYHYRPQANWINDPNGLCQVDGWYHLYFQHIPMAHCGMICIGDTPAHET